MKDVLELSSYVSTTIYENGCEDIPLSLS